MKPNLLLSVNHAKECLDYHPETGVLSWKVRPKAHFSTEKRWKIWNTRYAGKEAGTPAHNGYLQIVLKPKFFLAHRLAWFVFHGRWPAFHIDHINGIKNDNRIANLREATHSENCMNTAKKKSNTSGSKGVFWHKAANKWGASIGFNGKNINLGVFNTIEEAVNSVRSAREQYHSSFANHG